MKFIIFDNEEKSKVNLLYLINGKTWSKSNKWFILETCKKKDQINFTCGQAKKRWNVFLYTNPQNEQDVELFQPLLARFFFVKIYYIW